MEVATRVASALSLTLETNLFRNTMPTSPDVCGAVYAKPGAPSELGFGADGVQRERPSVQLVFRGVPGDVDGPTAMAVSAVADLAKVQDQLLSGTRYFLITPQQSQPFVLKRDEAERVYVAVGLSVYKAPA